MIPGSSTSYEELVKSYKIDVGMHKHKGKETRGNLFKTNPYAMIHAINQLEYRHAMNIHQAN